MLFTSVQPHHDRTAASRLYSATASTPPHRLQNRRTGFIYTSLLQVLTYCCFSVRRRSEKVATLQVLENKIKGWGLFGSKYEDAANLYQKAANSFKLSKSWDKAATVYQIG
ncbi:hypothetical protein ACS0TY_005619 [Phlomoides rotata]